MTASIETYNGWTNRETWLISLWIDNEQVSYNYWRGRAAEISESATSDPYLTREELARYELARALQEEFEEANPLTDEASFWNDLLTGALGRVEWSEVARNLLEES